MGDVINPKTGRLIKVGGPTYQKLMRSKWADQLRDTSMEISAPSNSKKGCSNKGKYKGVPKEMFCGSEGGSCPETFPANTKKRAKAALAYARHAPNPEGIKRCVKRLWP